MNDEYPGNSMRKVPTAEPEAPREKLVEQVTTGKVIVQKPSYGRRFKAAFVADDGESVAKHILREVVFPSGRDLVFEAGSELLAQVLGVESRVGYRKGQNFNYASVASSLASKVSYSRPAFMSNPRDRQESRRGAPVGQNVTRGRINIDDILCESRGEAMEVINRLEILIAAYGQATVADLFDLIGKTGEYTDEKFGWTSLEGARPHRTSHGYLLDLPRPVQL